MQRQALDAARGGRTDRPFDRLEEGGVGLRVPKRAAFDVERRDPLFGNEEAHRAFALRQFFADPFADPAAFLGRRAHQRHIRVVLVEEAGAVFLRDGRRRPEIDHVERADRADIGQPGAGDRAEAVRRRRQHAAEQHVADFCRGDVDDAGQQAAVGEFLHRAAARTGGMKDHAVVVVTQGFGDRGDAGRGDAEHGQPDRGFSLVDRSRARGHAGNGLGGVVQDHARDAVQAGHVGDRRHHDDVRHVDIGRGVAGSERRDHQLGDAQRQRTHAGGDDRGAAAAADADDAGDVVPRGDETGESDAHRRNGGSPVVGDQDGGRSIGMPGRHLARLDVDRNHRATGADIDAGDSCARRCDGVGQIGEFLALGVGRADNVDALHRRSSVSPCRFQVAALHFYETRVSY